MTANAVSEIRRRESTVWLRSIQQALWRATPVAVQQKLLWPTGSPVNDWHSFDCKPWTHPWLTQTNIRSFRAFSDQWLGRVEAEFDARESKKRGHYAFVGNMANNLYGRAKSIKASSMNIDMVLHPSDHLLMSQPTWEEYGGIAPEGVLTLSQAHEAGLALPDVQGVYRHDMVPWVEVMPQNLSDSMRLMDLKRFGDYFCYLPTIAALLKYDATLAVQFPYLSYLSGKPYAVTQMGGDIWFECSRDDIYGRLQRRAFESASVFIISNPWSMAFARRYGMKHMIYLPFLMDENRYSPGEPAFRHEWEVTSGGSFFVLMTSRLDYLFKGSQIAITAFARFSALVPQARLVVTGWGADQARALELLRALNIADKVIVLPVSGKRRMVEYLRSAHCLIDQLSLGYYGASALEGMACGLPVIMNLNHEQYDALLPEGCAPVCQAATEDDVLRHLLALHDNPNLRVDVGAGLRRWFLETHSNKKWGKKYEAVLWGTAERRVPNFMASPLRALLEKDEIRYHASQLRSAPQFPNYS